MAYLLFNPNGRISPGQFWTGVIILLAASIVISALAAFGPAGLGALWTVLSLALIYPSVCVYAKRFHDAGKSGWWYLAVIAVGFAVSMILAAVLTFPRMGELTELGLGTPEYVEATRQLQRDLFFPSVVVSTIVSLAIAYVVASLKSDPEENIYGPPTTNAQAPVS